MRYGPLKTNISDTSEHLKDVPAQGKQKRGNAKQKTYEGRGSEIETIYAVSPISGLERDMTNVIE